MIWLTGYESAPATNKVAFTIIKKRFKDAGFSVHLVTLENVVDFLG